MHLLLLWCVSTFSSIFVSSVHMKVTYSSKKYMYAFANSWRFSLFTLELSLVFKSKLICTIKHFPNKNYDFKILSIIFPKAILPWQNFVLGVFVLHPWNKSKNGCLKVKTKCIFILHVTLPFTYVRVEEDTPDASS